ncbi:deoxyribodipyrimidine photo-lyase isoform X1 [Selaginella moellendorffii]|uniref:deoxyribodipyrimidine photo-lyase isoform X1 n=1 Tax=Selaginella moellendorffii TaxID=88036 RepID=UPI000D1C5435|nr:deoxyribodipyrimidine photo-lyase isoform X1 [Selaginella moellendorffii]|eukprot:XP_024533022.1 deoxyribodipyrimidine photo-lyase isoform X1 [Selaginella moellendorffii]
MSQLSGKKEVAGALDAAAAGAKKPKLDADGGGFLGEGLRSSIGVNPRRVRVLRQGDESHSGPVVYWMSRDQRSRDNWALLYAAEQARKRDTPVAVVFNLVESFLEAKARHFGFLLRGLRVVEKNLDKLGIAFFLLRGRPEDTIPSFVEACNASILVLDFSSLRIGRTWRTGVVSRLGADTTTAVHEVDAHNVVPVWIASDKLEYAARTIRLKIQRQLPEFLVDFPTLEPFSKPWPGVAQEKIDWDSLIDEVLRAGDEVPEVDWCEPGEDIALERLAVFLSSRLQRYSAERNDPSKLERLSDLSPYFHYGQLSPQRCAFEVRKARKLHMQSVDSFLEELIIRRELSDNFCYYQPNYDNIQGAWEWARNSLLEHANDKREHIYTRQQLEDGKTKDKVRDLNSMNRLLVSFFDFFSEQLWNASQLEMVHRGKMHGFMRMYWAKKILEWTESPEDALAIAIYFNDKYQLDGRDPNGYVGCMWSICGIHDQGWKERPIFGKIRYMNYEGCKRKFNVDGYIMYVNKLVAEVKKRRKR